MRKNDHEIRIVDAHVIAQHRLRMQVSCARENRSPGMNHDRHAVCLSSLVNRPKAGIAVDVIIGRKDLMRRMHLDRSNPKLREAVHFRARIWNCSRQHSPECNETIWRRATIFRAPIVHLRSESNNLRRDIVDQPRALHSQSIQKCEKGIRIGAIPFNVGVVPAAMFHQLVGGRLHHVIRHDVDVNVYDRLQGSPPFAEACI